MRSGKTHADYSKGFSAKQASSRARGAVPDRGKLSQFRVIQRELVYVIGIPIEIANEEELGKFEYFGQYGPIKKIVVNNQTAHAGGFQRLTVSAYVTFVNIEDAYECIYALEDFSINGHSIKASFGTSKYCSAFLNGQKCNNPECMYLHYVGEPDDSFATDEIQQNTPRFIELSRPTRPYDYDDYDFFDSKPTEFPPRRNLVASKTRATLPPPAETENLELQEAQSGNEEGKVRKSDFLDSIWVNEPPVPFKVDYSVSQSLYDQLCLSRSTVRSIFQHS